jgi:hypothetical protein
MGTLTTDGLLVSTGHELATDDAERASPGSAVCAIAFGLMWASGLALLALAFATWTATSAWSFPRFLVALVFLVYLPGRFVIQTARLRLAPVELLMLAMVLGMTVGSVIYWFAGILRVPGLFLLWPGGASIVVLYRSRNVWSTLRRSDVFRWDDKSKLDGSHLWLTALILMAWGLLAIVPFYYQDLALLPENGMSIGHSAAFPDVFLHLSLANELSHTVPPQVPFIAGKPLSYHVGVDVLAAMFMTGGGLSAVDLTVRFLPTFHIAVAILAIFCFCRAWLGSGNLAAATTLLVVFGEDFSWLFAWTGNAGCWSADYFKVPTAFSLYSVNPMLPALGLLFSGFFCLQKFFEEGGKIWLLLTAFLLAISLEFKVFTALHVVMTLFLAAIVYAVCRRDLRFFKVFSLTSVLLGPLLLMLRQSNQTGAEQSFIFYPATYVPHFLTVLGLTRYSWAGDVCELLSTGHITASGVTALLLFALPAYLLGCLGPRIVGLPLLGKSLAAPQRMAPLRWFLALFVGLGILISLSFTVAQRNAPPGAQYNNAVWFFVQSKYVAWLFVGEFLVLIGRQRGRAFQAGVLILILGASIPSTIQFFHCFSRAKLEVLEKNELAMLNFLRDHASPGDVVVTREEYAAPDDTTSRPVAPIAALTRCRTLLTDVFAKSFASPEELQRRSRDLQEFWAAWAKGTLRTDLLNGYRVEYLIVNRRPDDDEHAPPGAVAVDEPAAPTVAVEQCFVNAGFLIYKVRRNPMAQ